MSVKSLRNQLLAAIAMVLVATIALGSSTYAWFASNGSVKAQGMNVQAVAEAGIEIAPMTWNETAGKYTASADYETVVEAAYGSTAVSLYPTSTLNATDWFHARAELMSASDAKAGTYAQLAGITPSKTTGLGTISGTEDLDGNYYLCNKFHIRTTNAEAIAKELTVSEITVTEAGDAADLNKAVRVAVVYDNSAYAIFAPVYDKASTAAANEVIYGITDAGLVQKSANGYKNSTNNVTYLDFNDAGNTDLEINYATGVTVDVYIFFEGEDTNLFSDNIDDVDVSALSVTVGFKATVEA